MATKSGRKIIFDRKYYTSLMKEFGYNPLEFEKIKKSFAEKSNLFRDSYIKLFLIYCSLKLA